MSARIHPGIGGALRRGLCIPAMPLALDANRRFDERRQRALIRYYAAAGAGGLAVAVHTTQFAIREPKVGLFKPLVEFASEALNVGRTFVRIAGICGASEQAIREAEILAKCGYHAGLLSLAGLRDATEDELVAHAERVGEIIPIIGFYLQPAVGGRALSYSFWRRFAEIPSVAAIKIAPFNRYQTIDVVRAIAESGRHDIALYTGNDDNIINDLLTTFRFKDRELRIVGGLLGHWAVWTRKAVELLDQCRGEPTAELLTRNIEVTDCNGAFFDAANGFAGCIAGLHEVLRRQGLLEGIWCLDPHETLSRGQMDEIDRVYRAYPHLNDDAFVREHLDEWLS